ncbi:methyltransferase domain-containing protein [Candidatus Woesearchaeota archaeon]|nr:methyltransferase domain-containing protein [Candidatus Woesearchaeota archaeon]
MDNSLLFFSTFVKYPKEIGSVVPSSRFLINKIIKNINFESAKCIVEYGPGTGCITSALLKEARQDTKIFCFEINERFCRYLSKKINDRRLVIINDSAENIKNYLKKYKITKVDYVISGLPFSTLNVPKRHLILQETKDTLNDKGKFVIYQFLYTFHKYINNYFSKITTRFVPLNIPPCFVCTCEK